jgi:hypothetical protein
MNSHVKPNQELRQAWGKLKHNLKMASFSDRVTKAAKRNQAATDANAIREILDRQNRHLQGDFSSSESEDSDSSYKPDEEVKTDRKRHKGSGSSSVNRHLTEMHIGTPPTQQVQATHHYGTRSKSKSGQATGQGSMTTTLIRTNSKVIVTPDKRDLMQIDDDEDDYGKEIISHNPNRSAFDRV